MTEAVTAPPWGRTFALAMGEIARFRVGPWTLRVQRHAHEWRARWETDDDPLSMAVGFTCPAGEASLDEEGTVNRYALQDAPGTFALVPRVADRAVVVRPARSFTLLPGGSADVYVSTSLWVAMELGPGGPLLFDVPVTRPSDTWFGPDTREGELCYASRTSARLELAELPLRPGRAVTRIHLDNRGQKAVQLERVHLPAPELQVYVDPRGHVWTEPVHVSLDADGEGQVRYGSGPPRHAPDAHPVGTPRRKAERALFARALSALWT